MNQRLLCIFYVGTTTSDYITLSMCVSFTCNSKVDKKLVFDANIIFNDAITHD